MEMLGWVGTALVIVAYVPQIRHLYVEECAWGISISTWLIWLVAGSLLLIYCVFRNDTLFTFVQVINITAIMATIILARRSNRICSDHLQTTLSSRDENCGAVRKAKDEARRNVMSRTRVVIDDKDGKDDGGNTRLMRAALDGHTEAVKDLLRKGADVNAQNHDGRTALMFAVINRHTDSVKALLKFGADVNVQAGCGCTPLMLAACSGDTGITQALLNSGAEANRICRPGKTALVVAVEHGYNAIVELLKRATGQITRVKPEGFHPLICPGEYPTDCRCRIRPANIDS